MGELLSANEPTFTAVLATAAGLLIALSVVLTQITNRFAIPVMLLFLGLGVAAGSEGIGAIPFENYELTYRFGTIALVLIIFDGGLNTRLDALRSVVGRSAVLATIGVVGVAVLLALGGMALGLSTAEALMLGAIVSSTDAAAVFSLLRGSGLHLRERVGRTLEVESGINDPMAVILTTVATSWAVSGGAPGVMLGVTVLVQIVVGMAIGWGGGVLGARMLARMEPSAAGLYPVFTAALALLVFGAASLLYGSGFLAVFVAALMLGNADLPYHNAILRVHDAIAWMCQVTMFVLLGLLAFPSRLAEVAPLGIALALMLAFGVRPLVISVLLAPFRPRLREVLCIGWVGLRGAVPIILATIPILAGAPGAYKVFDLVFFVVLVGLIVPGALVSPAVRMLGQNEDAPPPAPAQVEIHATRVLDGEILTFYLDASREVVGRKVADLALPPGATLMLIVRGRRLIAPRGHTVLEPEDHVFVFCSHEDHRAVTERFERAQALFLPDAPAPRSSMR